MLASKPTWTAPNIDWASVKAIVFDLGNVLIDLDNDFYGKGWPAGINENELDSFKQWVADKDLWLRYEKGEIGSKVFIDALSKYLELSPKQVVKYWNRILLGIQPKRFDLLTRLKKLFPLFVLSNTNDLHIEWVRRHVSELGIPDFETRYFEQIFYSYEIGAVKPEFEIYAAAESGIGLPSQQLLFIDDREENIEAALARGWQAVLLPPEVEVELVFENFNINRF